MKKFSPNNRLILETYKTDGSIRSEVKNGFAFVQQKTKLVGLRVLIDTAIGDLKIPAGSIAYLLEEDLHTKPWAKKVLNADSVEEPFIIVSSSDVQFTVEEDRRSSRSE